LTLLYSKLIFRLKQTVKLKGTPVLALSQRSDIVSLGEDRLLFIPFFIFLFVKFRKLKAVWLFFNIPKLF